MCLARITEVLPGGLPGYDATLQVYNISKAQVLHHLKCLTASSPRAAVDGVLGAWVQAAQLILKVRCVKVYVLRIG